MRSSTIILTIFFLAVGLTAGYPSVLATEKNSPVLESRNLFQQLLINQIVNVLPQNARDQINDAAALFGMTRNEFLIRCLRELQAFQTYSKTDFITAIQKIVKFVDEKLTREEQKQLETLEPVAVKLGSLVFTNQITESQKNQVYDLVVKVVRQQINGQTLVIELPVLIEKILSEHA